MASVAAAVEPTKVEAAEAVAPFGGVNGLSLFRSEQLRWVSTSNPSLQAIEATLNKCGLKPLNDKGEQSRWTELAQQLKDVPIEVFFAFIAAISPNKYQNPLRFDLNAKSIEGLVDEIKNRITSVVDAIVRVPDGQHNVENTLLPLAEASQVCSSIKTCANFMAHVSADPEIRNASSAADEKLSAFDVELNMREDLYKAVVDLRKNEPNLQGEHKRYVDRSIRDFERNGLHLPKDVRDQIKDIQTKMSSLCIQFQKNLGEEKTTYDLSKEELAGLPNDNFERLAKATDTDGKETGKYRVSLKYPDYFPIMKLCKVESTRKKLEQGFNSRCMAENSKILEELVHLRAEQSRLLGAKNHASYILDIRMAKTPEKVLQFLQDLSTKLDPLSADDMKALLALKEKEKKELGEAFDGKINMWDYNYYTRLREELEYQVNQEEVRQYFPLEVVFKGMFDIYQELLSVRFEVVDKPHIWFEDVTLYNVFDSESNEFIGQLYLDLFPRDGKYGHAACFGLISGCHMFNKFQAQSQSQAVESKDKEPRQFPVAAMVANFTKPTKDKPSLLDHDETVTAFHELGHCLHSVLSKTHYAEFAGTAVETDFVEAPSQMLENWCWQKEALLRLSGHVDDHNKKLPDEMLQKLLAAKNANAGLFNKRQITFGMFDQQIHTVDKVDTATTFSQVSKQIFGIESTPNTNFAATFGHLAGGYDCGYYGYLWSEVFAADMFASRFEKQGIFNKQLGMEYRRQILQPGGSRDAIDSLKAFLGREPQLEPFLVSKGLKL